MTATHLFAAVFPLLLIADTTDFFQEDLSPPVLFFARSACQEKIMCSAFV